MANRPVYVVREKEPFYSIMDVDFQWSSGFAKCQKQKNIVALHEGFHNIKPKLNILEISSKSLQEEGILMSAFNLQKYVPSLKKTVSVECAYQAGKVFKNGGPYTDLFASTSREAKRDERLKTSGELIGFEFEGQKFPVTPKSLFYDYLYINALFENKELAKKLLNYDAFTDIEFNPKTALNCQARAAATFVSLYRMGLIEK
ncbi:hypothetical protein P261_02190 [Lachnospiraceae bacterium TWA4]|nr:hypothetical protein P261_02190 [Lachnospiraceae bacterium TWA4]